MMIWRSASVRRKKRRVCLAASSRAAPFAPQRLVELPLSTNDTCHTIGLDLGTLSTLVITKRMRADFRGVNRRRRWGTPRESRASARSLEVFAAAGPARRPPPHEHVCAAPSERTNGARPPRSCTANDVGPFLATSIMGRLAARVVGGVVVRGGFERLARPREHLGDARAGLGTPRREPLRRLRHPDDHARPGVHPKG